MKIRNQGAALILTLAVLTGCDTAARAAEFIKEINGKVVGSYDDRWIKDVNGKLVGSYDEKFIKDVSGKLVGSYDDRFIKDVSGKILGTYDDMFIKDITGKILGRHDGGKGRAAAGGLLLLLRQCAFPGEVSLWGGVGAWRCARVIFGAELPFAAASPRDSRACRRGVRRQGRSDLVPNSVAPRSLGETRSVVRCP